MSSKTSHFFILSCLLITVLLDQIGLFLVFPIIPSLLTSINGASVVDNSVIGGWLLATYGLMQFIFAPIMGAVSDRFGRKPVLLVCFLAFTLDYLLYAIAQNIYLLFVARIFAGIAGSSIVVSMASIADISNENNRTKNYAYLFAAINLGMIAGPLISSLSVDYGIRMPFYIAFFFSLISLLLIIVFYRETLSPQNRRPFVLKSPLGSLLQISKYKGVGHLLLVQFLIVMAFQVPISLWSFFTKYRFAWTDSEIAHSFIALGVMGFLTQAFLVKKLYPILGNLKIAYLGFGLFALGECLIAVSINSTFFYFALVIYSLAGICNSAITSLFSSKVAPSEQGQLMGTLSSLNSLCAIIGPILATYAYHYSANLKLPFSDGYPFIFSSLMTVGCLFLLRYSMGTDNSKSLPS